jgi:hypothetical protein
MDTRTLTPTLSVTKTLPAGVHDAAVPAQLRQGDVMLLSVPALPAEAIEVEQPKGGYALMPAKPGSDAAGSHFIGDGALVSGYAMGGAGVSYLVISGFAWLTHHEHKALLVTPGTWRVLRQREHVATSADVVPTVRAIAD